MNGNDVFNVSNATTVVTETAGNQATVNTTLSAYTLPANITNLTFVGTGNFTGTGNTLNDTIIGGAGNDKIIAGAGIDTMTGGPGADTFVFASIQQIHNGATNGTRDAITDFTVGQDKIDFSAIDANTGLAGQQHFTFLPTAGQALTAPAQIHFVYTTIGGVDHTIIEGNVNANLAPDFRLDLVGHIALTASDFIL
jgi:Ca2+-binding RTX toxin-like protein